MKKQFALTILFLLCLGFLHEQTVTVSEGGNKLTFFINASTTEAQIKKADSVFAAHGVTLAIDTSRKNNKIVKASVSVNCDRGSTSYCGTKESIAQTGITILVDRNKDAKVDLCVGVCNAGK